MHYKKKGKILDKRRKDEKRIREQIRDKIQEIEKRREEEEE